MKLPGPPKDLKTLLPARRFEREEAEALLRPFLESDPRLYPIVWGCRFRREREHYELERLRAVAPPVRDR